MSHPSSPAPNLDPYFVSQGDALKGNAKWMPPCDEEIRLDLLPTESAFRLAGTLGMVLAASIFVIFAVPVSGILRVAGEPGGVLLGEDWILRRWIVRMASILTLAVVAAVTSWGLIRLHPWSRWVLLGLGTVPLWTLGFTVGLRIRGGGSVLQGLGDVLAMLCASIFVIPSSITAFWAACARRGRMVLGLHYNGLVARTSKLSPSWKMEIPLGVGLAFAMLVLYWMLLLLFLEVLAQCGVIRTS